LTLSLEFTRSRTFACMVIKNIPHRGIRIFFFYGTPRENQSPKPVFETPKILRIGRKDVIC
ncbi:MAG: hypothetical protein ACP5OC_09010, partial [Thermoplasmata archaeon]